MSEHGRGSAGCAGGHAAAVLNASEFGFEALIVTASELRLVPLTTVDEETLRGRTAELTAAIRQFHVRGTGYALRVSAVDEVVECLAWSWDAVADPHPQRRNHQRH